MAHWVKTDIGWINLEQFALASPYDDGRLALYTADQPDDQDWIVLGSGDGALVAQHLDDLARVAEDARAAREERRAAREAEWATS